VGETLGIGTEAARQHASRARRAMADAPDPTPDPEHEEAVQRFLAAMATGDLDAIVATLHPDVVVIGDANGTTGTAVNIIRGPDKFARFYLGLFARYGDTVLQSLEPVMVNGQLGLWTAGWNGGDARTSSPERVGGFTVRDGLVAATYDFVNPEKLGGVRLESSPAR
jgi:RNA polymerase sigma-70 factor (ECF subfamily)